MKKICVITGGSGGIGFSLAENFNNKGFQVIVLDIMKNEKMSKDIDFINCDLSNAESIKNSFLEIKNRFGKVHILINNGAISRFEKFIIDVEVDEFDKMINTNLRGVYLCSQEFIRLNSEEDYGRIINIASTRWNQNEKNWDIYGATKGGVVSLTSSLAISLSETPITVNCISPGWIQCENYDSLSESDHREHPSGRVGKPKDIFNMCYFLVNPENDFINGENIVIDGGMTKKMIYL